ncbi:hypothetical protein BpHYR1_001524 [Brachionus plicatilis]|uniref:DUF3987 domain-containing protein n=1 Tax=Brachionus plicatilis TaxID=10195 RepID=A0A3M7RMU1_BRAPC|nr:hypothetical protein BpHYR1_001524 [Brachionus plicatilis]
MAEKIKFEESIKIVRKCFGIQYPSIFDDQISNFLNSISTEHGTSTGFLLCPLITAISNLMGMSYVTALRSLKETCVLYTSLIGLASTGKSPAMKIVKDAYRQVEKFSSVPYEKSKFINAATVEGLLRHTKSLKYVLSFFDEASTFFGAIAMYKGASSASYDRSVFLELYNGPDVYQRDISGERLVLENPRLNLCLLGHPSLFIGLVTNEAQQNDDGLIQRFLLCAPDPGFIDWNTISNAGPKCCSLSVIFYLILKSNEKPIRYILDEEANHEFELIFSKYRKYVQHFHDKDGFLSAICGKAASQVLRLSMIFHCFEIVFNLLMKNISLDKFEINLSHQEFAENLSATDNFNIIKLKNLKDAHDMVSYFNKTKLILANYEAKCWNEDIFIIFDHILKVTVTSSLSLLELKVCKQILSYNSIEIDSNEINQKSSKDIKAKNVISCFEYLQNLGLGNIREEKSGCFKKIKKIFRKIDRQQLSQNLSLAIILEDFEVPLEEFLVKTETSKSSNNSFSLTKRNLSFDESPNSKKSTNFVENDLESSFNNSFTLTHNKDKRDKREEEAIGLDSEPNENPGENSNVRFSNECKEETGRPSRSCNSKTLKNKKPDSDSISKRKKANKQTKTTSLDVLDPSDLNIV